MDENVQPEYDENDENNELEDYDFFDDEMMLDFDEDMDDDMIAEEDALNVVQDTMENFLAPAHVSAVYGEPIQSGETLIIPTAEILSVAGFGVGSGYATGPEGDENGGSGGGAGGGGGGRVLARPVAVIIASPEGVRIEPVVDATKIALGFLTALGFMIAMIARMLNPRKVLGDINRR
ncbi:MAG TPA: spore germination protein GerW family protein [Anaerolineales bacterium]|nr:spore germination protein GerW family protein [Anaerolineales bacterium]